MMMGSLARAGISHRQRFVVQSVFRGRISKCVTGKVLQVLEGKYQSDPLEYGSIRVSGTEGGCLADKCYLGEMISHLSEMIST